MQFTLSAIKKYLRTDLGAAQIADALTLLGLEVKEMRDMRAPLAEFIVGEVVEENPHPDSDHLHLLSVDTGRGILQVVCGAPNARKGLKGVLARPGDIIPESGDRLKKGVIRGVESQGMMCSARELGLGADHDGIIELPANAKAGEPAVGILEKTYNIDVVFDAEATANRPDYLGVIGIARDLAAGGSGEFIEPATEPAKGAFKSDIKVINEAPEKAPQFNIRHIRGVKNGESPEWLKNYLTALGTNTISTLVDITNYFAIDMCRPLHVFDTDKIKGALRVGHAKEGEKFLALDGNEYTLAAGDIVIRDDNGVQSLAGVMGGAASGCSPETKNVLLEAAYFDPVAVRKTAKRLNIESDAKYRFERGIDPASTGWGMEAATNMILKLCGGEASNVIATGANPYRETHVEFPVEYFEKRIGVAMDKKTMAEILSRLGCRVKDNGAALSIVPPSWRGDIKAKEDITEELIRIYGYDKLPAEPVAAGDMRPMLSTRQRRARDARRLMASRGLVEVYTWSFYSPDKDETGKPIELANPIVAELSAMRRAIMPNLIDGAAANIARSVHSAALFEIAPAFDGIEPGQQHTSAAGLRYGLIREKDWSGEAERASAYDAKADALAILKLYGIPEAKVKYSTDGLLSYTHPHRSANIIAAGKNIGWFGEIHPLALKRAGIKNAAAAGFELNLDLLPEAKAKGPAKKKLPLSEFQPVARDFAFLFDADAPADAIIRAVKGADPLVAEAYIFDIFTGANTEGRKSVAVKAVIAPIEKTLSEAEIQAVADRIVAAAAKLGGELRDK